MNSFFFFFLVFWISDRISVTLDEILRNTTSSEKVLKSFFLKASRRGTEGTVIHIKFILLLMSGIFSVIVAFFIPHYMKNLKTCNKKLFFMNWSWKPAIVFHFPVDTGRKLNVHKMFRRFPGRLLNVICTFNLRSVSKELSIRILRKISYVRHFLFHDFKSTLMQIWKFINIFVFIWK